MLIQENPDEGNLLDREGVDMTNQFLSLKKKKGQRKRDDHFDNNFDIREFFTKKKQALIYQKEKKKGSRIKLIQEDEKKTVWMMMGCASQERINCTSKTCSSSGQSSCTRSPTKSSSPASPTPKSLIKMTWNTWRRRSESSKAGRWSHRSSLIASLRFSV